MTAEYILSSGNPQVIIYEWGIRTFGDSTSNPLNLAALALMKDWSHPPMIVDPTHDTGVRELISRICRAAISATSDGLMVKSIHIRKRLSQRVSRPSYRTSSRTSPPACNPT